MSSDVGGHLEKTCQEHQPKEEGEEGQTVVAHDGNGHSCESVEEEEVGEGLQLLVWGSRPAEMKVGCPSGASLGGGYGWVDLRGQLAALCCSSLLVKSCRYRCHCCCWCCGSVGHRCLDHETLGPGPPRCCLPCPCRGRRRTGGEAESWGETPGSLLSLGQECTQSQTF